MRRGLAAVGIAASLGLVGCGPQPDTQLGIMVPAAGNGRLQLTRIGVVEDDLAYDGKRGEYVITDKQTGKEYVGVSGIGITEIGSHQQGKTQEEDEQ